MARKYVKIGENNGKIYVSCLSDRPYRAYNCVCTVCGHEFVAAGQDVFKYSDTGCAVCRKKQREEASLNDAQKYIGQRFGKLEIIGISGFKRIYGKNHLVVSCKCCKCGNVADYILSKLKSGQVQQCKKCNLLNLKVGHEISQASHIGGTSIIAIDGRRKTNKNSKTECNGVSFNEKTKKYRAYINFCRHQYHLGVYDNLNDAIEARKKAEDLLYGDFLKQYAETYPAQWEKMRKNKV